MKTHIALIAMIAAAMPAWGASDSPVDVLSTNTCPVVVGTVKSVETDPARFGTAIVLDHIMPAAGVGRWVRDGTINALVPAVNMKSFPALESYVGQEVAVWPYPSVSRGGVFPPITMPDQLQLLSMAMADPKKTWCYLPAFKKRYG